MPRGPKGEKRPADVVILEITPPGFSPLTASAQARQSYRRRGPACLRRGALFSALRRKRRSAILRRRVAKGHERTDALQQSWGEFRN